MLLNIFDTHMFKASFPLHFFRKLPEFFLISAAELIYLLYMVLVSLKMSIVSLGGNTELRLAMLREVVALISHL